MCVTVFEHMHLYLDAHRGQKWSKSCESRVIGGYEHPNFSVLRQNFSPLQEEQCS